MKLLLHHFAVIDPEPLLVLGRDARLEWLERVPREAPLDDDVASILEPTLAWLLSENPVSDRAPHQSGLHLTGVTLFRAEQCTALAELLDRWIHVFRLAPDRFSLRRSSEDRTWLVRDEVVDQLASLRDLATRASESGRALLHLGL